MTVFDSIPLPRGRQLITIEDNVLCRRYVKSASWSPVTNHSKVDPVNQIRTKRLGGAHRGHRLLQSTDVRSKRHDSA